MGYTTNFEGEFRCRRAVASEIDVFLSEAERDSTVIGILADWLEEQGDDFVNSPKSDGAASPKSCDFGYPSGGSAND